MIGHGTSWEWAKRCLISAPQEAVNLPPRVPQAILLAITLWRLALQAPEWTQGLPVRNRRP
jgi:hypothetical protein